MKQQLKYGLNFKTIRIIVNFLLIVLSSNYLSAQQITNQANFFQLEQHATDSYHNLDDDTDPLESFNRIMFNIHKILDGLFFQPITEIYNLIAHPFVKEHVHYALQNLSTPSIFLNDCLQGNAEGAQQSLIRFLLNSTFGILGFYDFARDVADIEFHRTDFGQTMSVYGIKSGPYLFIPLIGPTNFRDFIGTLIDVTTDPFNYAIRRYSNEDIVYIRSIMGAIDQRSGLDDVIKNIMKAYDPYMRFKLFYSQNREYKLNNGEMNMDTPTPDDE